MDSDMREFAAFCPGHITGIFQICDQTADPLKEGSRGAGVSIAKGVTTRVRIRNSSKNSFKIRINGKTKSAKVSERVINAFFSRVEKNYRITVDHDVEIPIGSGFGSSGAGSLSSALALNEAFGCGLSLIEAAQVAHIAEVECKTGLGTVIAETSGGLEIRTKPGGPGVGQVKTIPIEGDYVMACLSFGPISTKEVLTNEKIRERINEFGGKLLDQLIAESCSMAMVGESIFSLTRRAEVDKLVKVFRGHASSKLSIIVTNIDFKGARLLD
jgi:pantoate kinase